MNHRPITIACLVLTAGALWSPRALAESYTVWSCRGPAGEPVPASAWESFGRQGLDGCDRGGALVAVAGGGYRFKAPAILGYRIWRSTTPPGWGYAALVEDPFSGPVSPGEPDPIVRTGVRLRGLEIVASCHVHCEAEFRLHRAAVDVEDASPPVAAGGAVLAGGSVAVPARDAGGGLRSAQALIDGRPVGSSEVCAEPYTRVEPCPRETTFMFAIDTAALPAGPHTLTVTATDAAGNTATLASQPLAVQPVVAPAPPRVTYRLAVAKRRFTAGARGAITGRVTPATAGVSVIVERRWYGARGGGWRRVATLSTDARGAFALRLPADAQQLRFRLAGSQPTRAVDVVSRLALSARMRPARLRNGEWVVLSGRLRGAGPAAAGATVHVQAMIHGRWQTVARVRAGRDGRFRWRYRFHNTRLEALYSFRARVPGSSERWPWPGVDSSRVRVHVLP